MPIRKKEEPLPERNVIVMLYGTPGSGKTSAAITSDNCLLIDTDRGADRAITRCDTLLCSSWDDVLAEKEAMRGYDTIILDTAKACLDDFICEYVQVKNPKLRTNTLRRFGEMAEEFKRFVSFLRGNNNNVDLIFVCHDKVTEDGDIIRHAPDCTGQSKSFLVRLSDQIGYVSVLNGRRTISWEPQENYEGKNVGALPLTEIPNATSSEFDGFMSGILKSVKAAIVGRNNKQSEVVGMIEDLREKLASASTIDDADDISKLAKGLPKALKAPFFEEMKKALAEKNIIWAGKKWETRSE